MFDIKPNSVVSNCCKIIYRNSYWSYKLKHNNDGGGSLKVTLDCFWIVFKIISCWIFRLFIFLLWLLEAYYSLFDLHIDSCIWSSCWVFNILAGQVKMMIHSWSKTWNHVIPSCSKNRPCPRMQMMVLMDSNYMELSCMSLPLQ